MDRTKAFGTLAVAILLIELLCGCVVVPGNGGSGTITVTDDNGRTVSVNASAQRLISLAPSDTEILYALDLGDKVVAVDNNTNFPAEAANKTKVSGYKWLDLETILSLTPDIIFAADINKDMVPQLEARGLKVIVLAPKNISGIFKDIRLVGKVMGIKDKANTLASQLEGRVKAVTDKTMAKGVFKLRTYLELDAFMGYYTYGPNTFGDELITLSGGDNIAARKEYVTIQYPMLTDEYIIASDPQVIVYQLGPWTTTTPQGIKGRTGWGNITAIKGNKLYGVDGDLISRPGPRIVDGLEAMARTIHPELIT